MRYERRHRWFLFLVSASLVALSFSLHSCGEDEEWYGEFDYETLNDDISDDVQYFTNAPYPANADTLRILAIGSSFTDDATYYIDKLVKASGIDEDRLCIYKVVEGFSRFNTWINKGKSGETLYPKRVTGNIEMLLAGSLIEILSQNWDVIILNQASDASYVWDTFSYLKEYMEMILEACPNKHVCFAFQLQWSHAPHEMPYVMQGNIACCQKMTKRFGVDVIIPVGTAIQIARGTSLNDKRYMTRDDYHLNKGIACYIASCTWFQKLLYPVFGTSVVGNTARPDGKYSGETVLLGQRCAEYAINNPYDYTYIIE